jgi:hypothetical protein
MTAQSEYRFFDRPVLVLSMAALTIMISMDCPPYIWLFCFTLWAHKWLISRQLAHIQLKPLSRRLTTTLAVTIFLILLFQYRSLFVQEAASSLLLSLTAVKVSDYETRRDHLSVILLGFLLLTLKPLFGLEIAWLPIQILSMIGLFWSMANEQKRLKKIKFLHVIAASFPLTLALALVFPRIVLPWAAGQGGSKTAQLGFTTDLKPGQFSELIESNEVVFHVSFPPGTMVSTEELFWRGAILKTAKGMEWSRSKNDFHREKKDLNRTEMRASSFEYEITFPRTTDQYLFTLDGTFELFSQEAKVIQVQENIWKLETASSGAKRLTATMSWGFKDQTPPSKEELAPTILPPKAQQWVRETLEELPDPNARRVALKKLFTDARLTYTKSPGTYDADAIDDFLFNRKRGFCEHFAGTYASLARALQIPARVISGYQGGEYNKVGNFWRITQRSAHAWVEIWTGTEWSRVDPTTWATEYEFSRTLEKKWFDWISEGIDTYENINFRWTNFILDFDQNQSVRKIKESIPQIILLVLSILVGLFIITALIKLIRSKNFDKRAALKFQLSELVEEIRSTVEMISEEDLSAETPLQLLNLAETKYKDSRLFFKNLSNIYDAVFYQEQFQEQEIKKTIQRLQKDWVQIKVLKNTF